MELGVIHLIVFNCLMIDLAVLVNWRRYSFLCSRLLIGQILVVVLFGWRIEVEDVTILYDSVNSINLGLSTRSLIYGKIASIISNYFQILFFKHRAVMLDCLLLLSNGRSLLRLAVGNKHGVLDWRYPAIISGGVLPADWRLGPLSRFVSIVFYGMGDCAVLILGVHSLNG